MRAQHSDLAAFLSELAAGAEDGAHRSPRATLQRKAAACALSTGTCDEKG